MFKLLSCNNIFQIQKCKTFFYFTLKPEVKELKHLKCRQLEPISSFIFHCSLHTTANREISSKEIFIENNCDNNINFPLFFSRFASFSRYYSVLERLKHFHLSALFIQRRVPLICLNKHHVPNNFYQLNDSNVSQ